MPWAGGSTTQWRAESGRLEVAVFDAAGQPLAGARVSVELIRPVEKRPPLAVALDRGDIGRFAGHRRPAGARQLGPRHRRRARQRALRADAADVPPMTDAALFALAARAAATAARLRALRRCRCAAAATHVLLRRLRQRACHHRRGGPRRVLPPARGDATPTGRCRSTPTSPPTPARSAQARPSSTCWSTAWTAPPASG